jgi:hypothetical protein
VQYYCNGCHTPFEHIKDDDVPGSVEIAHIGTTPSLGTREECPCS